jgi:hypothetical protein
VDPHLSHGYAVDDRVERPVQSRLRRPMLPELCPQYLSAPGLELLGSKSWLRHQHNLLAVVVIRNSYVREQLHLSTNGSPNPALVSYLPNVDTISPHHNATTHNSHNVLHTSYLAPNRWSYPGIASGSIEGEFSVISAAKG